jgi:hypothetical protein
MMTTIIIAKAEYIYWESKLLASVACLAELFKLVYGPFGWSNLHRALDFCPDQPLEGIKCTKAKSVLY